MSEVSTPSPVPLPPRKSASASKPRPANAGPTKPRKGRKSKSVEVAQFNGTRILNELRRVERCVRFLFGERESYAAHGSVAVARAFRVDVALLCMGAARVAVAGPAPLTFTAAEGVDAARAFASASIVPLHFEGWAHFSETRRDIARAFEAVGLQQRLHWLPPGVPEEFPASRTTAPRDLRG